MPYICKKKLTLKQVHFETDIYATQSGKRYDFLQPTIIY
jgi:hypothetical protein